MYVYVCHVWRSEADCWALLFASCHVDLGIKFRLSGSYNPLPLPHLVKFSEPWRGDTNVPRRDEHSVIIYFQYLDRF